MQCFPARPYDTLEEVIGLRGTAGHGSLAEWGVAYDELPRPPTGGAVVFAALPAAITPGRQQLRTPSIVFCRISALQRCMLSGTLLGCGWHVASVLAHERLLCPSP